MAFDACMLSAVLREINDSAAGGRVDKIWQPERDETVFAIRSAGRDLRLLIDSGSSTPRMNLSGMKPENPAAPPMFCMLLRKHFSGARFLRAFQPTFDRVACLVFECRDEMGFKTEKTLVAEIMGKYSNLIVAEGGDPDDLKIIGVLKPIDFSASRIRQLLPGMKYDLPPSQNKLDPTAADAETFDRAAREADPSSTAEKFITGTFSGIAKSTAREIAYRASGDPSATLGGCGNRLRDEFLALFRNLREGNFSPTVVFDGDGKPVEYSFTDLTQYGPDAKKERFDTVGAMIDAFYGRRTEKERLRRRAADILRILSNAEARIEKKKALQQEELLNCENGETYKLWGDLITANMYALRRGMTSASLPNWYGNGETVDVPLSERMTPAQNAQAYYKKYTKSKTAKIHLTEQLERDGRELEYVRSVLDMLSRAKTEAELSEIRAELFESGYASKMKNYVPPKKRAPLISRYETSDGRQVLCGKNNVANDHLTMKQAGRSDMWLHVKDYPGSHVVMEMFPGEEEPPSDALYEAALIAAHNSKLADSHTVPVDYTLVKNVKKPSGAKPGFVIYRTNRTVYVDPDPERVEKMAR